MKYYNIPIFVPHEGCPFDCVFCNQRRITGNLSKVNEKTIKNTIKEYLKTLPKKDSKIEVAFFGGSFTGIDFDVQKRFLSTAYEFVKSGEISGIRVSTRPDYIDDKILQELSLYNVTTIELGVQSMDDEVLKLSGRGHTSECVVEAVRKIREYDFSLGLQMMTGLVGDTDEKSLKTADKIIELKPDFVRIYPTLVVKDTHLEKLYNNGEYNPQSVDDAIELCKKLLIKFKSANIDVIRISLQTTDEISPSGSIVAGPYDAQFRERVESGIYCDKIIDELLDFKEKKVLVLVNDKEISKAVGKHRENVKKIKEKLGIDILIKGCCDIKIGEYKIEKIQEGEGSDCI